MIAAIATMLLRRPFLVIIALVIGTWAGASDAAQPPGQGPCAEDIAAFCKDVQPGGGRIAGA